MFGGGTRQAGIIAAPARCAVDETFGLQPDGSDGKLAASHERAKGVAEMWTAEGRGVGVACGDEYGVVGFEGCEGE